MVYRQLLIVLTRCPEDSEDTNTMFHCGCLAEITNAVNDHSAINTNSRKGTVKKKGPTINTRLRQSQREKQLRSLFLSCQGYSRHSKYSHKLMTQLSW